MCGAGKDERFIEVPAWSGYFTGFTISLLLHSFLLEHESGTVVGSWNPRKKKLKYLRTYLHVMEDSCIVLYLPPVLEDSFRGSH